MIPISMKNIYVNKKQQEQDLSYAYFENLGNVWKRREIS